MNTPPSPSLRSTIRRPAFAAGLALGLILGPLAAATLSPTRADLDAKANVDVPDARGAEPAAPVVRGVLHANFEDPERQGRGLKNLANVLKALEAEGAPAPELLVVAHGPGIDLVVSETTRHAEAVAALLEKGVRFVACQNTMRERDLAPGDLLPGVGTVPAGALEVMRRQNGGYAYFRP